MSKESDPNEIEILKEIKKNRGCDIAHLYGHFRIEADSTNMELLIRRVTRLIDAKLINSFDLDGRYFITTEGKNFLREVGWFPFDRDTVTVILQIGMLVCAMIMLVTTYQLLYISFQMVENERIPIISLTPDSDFNVNVIL